MRRDNYHHHRRRFVPVATMNTHTLSVAGKKSWVPGYLSTIKGIDYFCCRSEKIAITDRFDIKRIRRSYPDGDTDKQLKLEV